MSGDRPLSVLLLADDQKGHPNTIHDHIQAFRRYSRHDVFLLNPRGLARSRFLDVSAFDVVVVHYSIVVIWDDYLSPWFRERIAEFDGLKVQFLQDEYRWVDRITAESRRLGIDVLYSVVPPDAVTGVYGDRLPGTEILPTLTGYVPDALRDRSVPPAAARPVDVGYRGRSLPYWLGRLGHEKVEIGRGFLSRAAGSGLRCDIAWTEGARIHGEAWNRFTASCRTMLASESGASVVDYDGAAEEAVKAHLARHPTATYEDVEREVLGPWLGGPSINTVSPRIFEAAAFRTGLVMFPGEYAGVIEPWRHYIPLEKDFGNLDEVVAAIRDTTSLEAMTSRAHAELIASGAYSERRFVEQFDHDLSARARPRHRGGGRPPRRRLKLEELSSGRSYRVSTLYALARELLLAWIGAREVARHRALRPLVRRALTGGRQARDDLFRLAILLSVARGKLVPAGGSFRIEPHWEAAEGRLTLRSVPDGEPAEPATAAALAGLAAGGLRELVWNHAGVGQYVTLRIPLLPRSVSFDVGRYDAYGVYRFETLAASARTAPRLVTRALEPLLQQSEAEREYRSAAARRATASDDEGLDP